MALGGGASPAGASVAAGEETAGGVEEELESSPQAVASKPAMQAIKAIGIGSWRSVRLGRKEVESVNHGPGSSRIAPENTDKARIHQIL
jgi:hypothetical protein